MIEVRLLAETWVEIYLWITSCPMFYVRLLEETRVEMMISNGIQPMNTGSSPCWDVNWNTMNTFREQESGVRLLAETWIEILTVSEGASADADMVRLLAETWFEITEVIWIKKLLYVRPLAETWVEITLPSFDILVNVVRLPGRDASWNHKVFRVLHNLHRSSPYGDVSWNSISAINKLSMYSSSPYGDVSWNRLDIGVNSDLFVFVSLRRRELK